MSSNCEIPKLLIEIESEIKIHEKNIRDYLLSKHKSDLIMNELLPIRQHVEILLGILRNLTRDYV